MTAAAAAAPPSLPQPAPSATAAEDTYRVRKVEFGGKVRQVFMQGENGPCALLAIANVLSLRGALDAKTPRVIHDDLSSAAGSVLVQLVADHLLNRSDSDPNSCKNVDDSLPLLATLQRGLDVNLGFSGSCASFEFSPELGLFDLAGVSLYHCWLVDPQDERAFGAVGRMKYNEAVVVARENEAVGEWLEETKSQMTVYGLVRLHESMREGELAALFHNNHFSVVHKRGGNLYALATDVGYLGTAVVWELLCETSGDVVFYDDKWQVFTGQSPTMAPLQQLPPASTSPQKVVQSQTDWELAVQLQAEENQEQPQAQAPQQAQPQQRGKGKGKRNQQKVEEDACSIC